jgi:hypothetical protein
MRCRSPLFHCALVLILAGCGSESPDGNADGTGGAGSGGAGSGGASTGGTTQLPVASLASMLEPMAERSDGTLATVVFSNLADSCEAAIDARRRNTEHAHTAATVLVFGLNSSRTLETGTYAMSHRYGREPPATGRFATAAMTVSDGSCSTGVSSSTSGSIEVDTVSDEGVSGSFSLQFENGTALQGEFDAPDCPGYATTLRDADAPEDKQCLPQEP